MKGMGYVSLFQKKLLALLRERVTSAYFLVSRVISCSNCRNALIACRTKVAQSRRGSLPLRFLGELDILSYITYPLGTRLPPIMEETNIFPSVHILSQLGVYGQGH